MKVGNEILIFIPWNKEVGSQWISGDGMKARSGFFSLFFFFFQKGGLLFDREQFLSAYGAWC